jgi:hypothetical protein
VNDTNEPFHILSHHLDHLASYLEMVAVPIVREVPVEDLVELGVLPAHEPEPLGMVGGDEPRLAIDNDVRDRDQCLVVEGDAVLRSFASYALSPHRRYWARLRTSTSSTDMLYSITF